MNNNEEIQEFIVRVRVQGKEALTVHLEPWADKFTINQSEILEFRIKGPLRRSPSEFIEIHVEPGVLTLFDNWAESEMQGRIAKEGDQGQAD